ncbi:MAG TPA: glycosyltransferase [Burkholderiaceae bacterium]|nr:glycosyltransferase [Burkholderiaceae bacterium]
MKSDPTIPAPPYPSDSGRTRDRPTVGFFVRIADPAQLEVLEFYRNDIESLRAFGLQVQCITRVRDLPRSTPGFYYAWWFGFGFFAVAWARLRARPCVLIGNVHTEDGRGLEGWPLHKRVLMKLALRFATATIFTSRTEIERLGPTRPSHPHVVYHAVDLDRHRPRQTPREETIVAITQLTRENLRRKLVLESLEAFAIFRRAHPRHRFVLIGQHGSGLVDVERRIDALGLRGAVDLTGRIDTNRKLEILQSATAYLQPSLCEGFGLAILEAQACGCPVVTNREPCIVEVNQSAVLYGDDPQAWAEQLSRLSDDVALWEEMRRRGLANAGRFADAGRRTALRAILTEAGFPDPVTPGAGVLQSRH